jgi:hypothetical protein
VEANILSLLHPDFHTPDTKVQSGALGGGSDLHDDSFEIIEMRYTKELIETAFSAWSLSLISENFANDQRV